MTIPARINGKVAPYLEAAVETALAEFRGHGLYERQVCAKIQAGESIYQLARDHDCLISQILLSGPETEARVAKKIVERISHVA